MATASFLHPQPLQSLEKRCQPKLPARYRLYSPALPPAAGGGKKLLYGTKQRAGYSLQLRACYDYPPPRGEAAYTPSLARAKQQPSSRKAAYRPPAHSPPGQPADPAPQAPGQQVYPPSQPQLPGNYYQQGLPPAAYPPQGWYYPGAYPPQGYYPQGPPPPPAAYPAGYNNYQGFSGGVNTGREFAEMARESGAASAVNKIIEDFWGWWSGGIADF